MGQTISNEILAYRADECMIKFHKTTHIMGFCFSIYELVQDLEDPNFKLCIDGATIFSSVSSFYLNSSRRHIVRNRWICCFDVCFFAFMSVLHVTSVVFLAFAYAEKEVSAEYAFGYIAYHCVSIISLGLFVVFKGLKYTCCRRGSDARDTYLHETRNVLTERKKSVGRGDFASADLLGEILLVRAKEMTTSKDPPAQTLRNEILSNV